MLAYIGGLVPLAIDDTSSDSSLYIYFCGSDFKQEHKSNLELQEFREDYITDLKDLRPEMDVFIEKGKHVVIGGGEPLLQRAPLMYLCAYIRNNEGKIELETNGSKPSVLKEILSKGIVERLTLLLHSPFESEKFQKITKSGTFFKSTEEVMNDVKESLAVLKEHQDNCDITIRTTVVPSLMFKKEELLAIASEIKDINCRWELVPYSSVGVTSKKYSGLKEPSMDFLERLKEECEREYPQMRIDVGEARAINIVREESEEESN